MSSNKRAKEKLIKLYGAECFIDKLKLRVDAEPRKYKSKGQYKRMKQLTFHHIKERRNGGKATVENGALLSVENHEWFNKQSSELQKQINKAFQEYKKFVECSVVFGEIETDVEVKGIIISTENLQKSYNRAKAKEKLRKEINDYDNSKSR